MYPIGETKVIKQSIAVGATNTGDLLKPPEGFEWLLYFLYGWQNNVDDSVMEWFVYSSEMDYSISLGGVSASTYTKVWFTPGPAQTSFNFGMPFRFTWDCYPFLTCGALEAGKKMEIFGMIMERPANLELTLRDWYAAILRTPLPAGLEGLKSRIEHYRGGI